MRFLPFVAMGVLAVAWLLPNHYFPWNSFYNESCAASAVAILSVGLGRAWLTGRVTATVWFVLAAALIPPAQWLAGQLDFSGDAFVSSLYIAGLAAAIATGWVWGRNDATAAATGLSGAILAGALASSVLAIAQSLGIVLSGLWVMDEPVGMRGYANLGQPNNLATLLGMGCVGLMYLVEAGKVRGSMAVAAALTLTCAAATTQSRAALLFGPILLAGAILAHRRKLAPRTDLLVVVVLVAAHWALTWYWPTVQQAAMLTTADSLSERGAHSLRFVLWPVMFEAVNQSPWFGYGWLQVGAAQLVVANQFPPIGHLWMHAHNLFVDLLVWCGYPLGLFLIGSILYWWTSRWWRASTLEGIVGLTAVTVFGWHAMLELPHHYAYFLVPVGLWIGIVDASMRVKAASAPTRVPGLAVAPGLAAALMMLAVWKDYPAVEEDYRLVRFENLGIGTLRASQPAPHAPFMSAQTTFLRIARTGPTANMDPNELADMEAITRRYPFARAMARLGWAWALNGRLPEALELFEKIRRVHGEPMYAKAKSDLQDVVGRGQVELRPLLDGLPK